jgi:hypothetical protein
MRRALQLGAQIAAALAELHGASPAIQVRDLKPHNVLIDADGESNMACDWFAVAAVYQQMPAVWTPTRDLITSRCGRRHGGDFGLWDRGDGEPHRQRQRHRDRHHDGGGRGDGAVHGARAVRQRPADIHRRRHLGVGVHHDRDDRRPSALVRRVLRPF